MLDGRPDLIFDRDQLFKLFDSFDLCESTATDLCDLCGLWELPPAPERYEAREDVAIPCW